MATPLSGKGIPTALAVADKDKAPNRKASQPPGKEPHKQKPAPALDQTKPAAGRPTAAKSPSQMATPLSGKGIPTALAVADKDKAHNRKASQPPGEEPHKQKPAPALDQTKPAAGRPTAAKSPSQMTAPLSGKGIPTAPAVADKDKTPNCKANQPPGKALHKQQSAPANKRAQKDAIKRLQKNRLSSDEQEIYDIVSAIEENKRKAKALKLDKNSVHKIPKRTQGHRIWGGFGKKDIIVTSINALHTTPIQNPLDTEQALHKDDARPSSRVRNQVTNPKYSHTGKTPSHPNKRMQLSYNRHTLDSIPEAHLQHEVWTSQGWATNLSQNFPSVPRPKRLRISQLPKTGKIRASLHDKPLQETKALRIVSKSQATKERRSRFMWTKLLRSVNKTTFLRAVAYILPQLVCLQHHRGQVLPSLTGKGTTNLPGVRIIRNVVYYLANRCTTESHSCIHLLNQVIIPMPPGPISVLQRIEAQLRSSSLMPQDAYKELITAVSDLLPTPNLVLVAAEAAIRKLTWRLPFIFDVPSRKACTLSTDQANDIYGSQKDIKKVHVDECTHQFTSQPEALQAMIDHVGIRFNRKDPTLFLDWVKLQTVLANEIQELIQASQSNDAEATLDEAGDVLYVASYGLQFSTGQQAGLAAVGEATVWSQMHYFSPASETITLFLNNVARLQRLTTGGAEVTEIWLEAQSLGAQWCCITGDDHTPTMSLDARLWGPPEQRDYADPPEQTTACYRIQLQAELQRLKESICLNSTRHAIPQARQALQQSLTTAQRLAYPLETMSTSQLDEQKSKPKIKETVQPPTAPESKIDTQQSQNSAPKPKIEQAEETAVLDPPHADTAALTVKAEKFQSQNSALKPKIERTEETAVLDSLHADIAALTVTKDSLHADIAALTVKASKFQSQNSAPKPEIERTEETAVLDSLTVPKPKIDAHQSQNSAPKPKIERTGETAVLDSLHADIAALTVTKDSLQADVAV